MLTSGEAGFGAGGSNGFVFYDIVAKCIYGSLFYLVVATAAMLTSGKAGFGAGRSDGFVYNHIVAEGSFADSTAFTYAGFGASRIGIRAYMGFGGRAFNHTRGEAKEGKTYQEKELCKDFEVFHFFLLFFCFFRW